MTYRTPELTLCPAPRAISLFAPLVRTLTMLLSECTSIPPYPWFSFLWFQLPTVSQSGSRWSYTSEGQQKPDTTSPGVCHWPHFIWSCRHLIVSHQHNKKKGEYRTRRRFERDHIHIAFITVYCYNCSIFIISYYSSLTIPKICKLTFTIGVYI